MASELKNQLNAAVKAAMKGGEKSRLGTLRLIMAAIKQYEVDNRAELDDPTTIDILTRMSKQRRESIAQFDAGGRQDLADKEREELAIIAEYLPQQLTSAEISQHVESAVRDSGAAGMRDMGKVMALLNQHLKGRADMAAVSALVKSRLAG